MPINVTVIKMRLLWFYLLSSYSPVFLSTFVISVVLDFSLHRNHHSSRMIACSRQWRTVDEVSVNKVKLQTNYILQSTFFSSVEHVPVKKEKSHCTGVLPWRDVFFAKHTMNNQDGGGWVKELTTNVTILTNRCICCPCSCWHSLSCPVL